MNHIFLTFLALFLLAGSVQAQNKISPVQLMTVEKTKWLNTTRPLVQSDFQGKAVLLDFWTYGCINCMQIIPDLDYLEEKFGNKLLIVGVHSAKFEGESGNSRILFAAKRFGLRHPVYNDADFAIWNSYGVKAWPTQILLGTDGREIARWSGEGHRKKIEAAIAEIKTTSDQAVPILKQENKTNLLFPARIEARSDALYIADSGHNQIVVTDPTGLGIARVGSGLKDDKDGSLTSASFNAPRGLAVQDKKIYIADTGSHKIRVIDLLRKKVDTLAGNGKRGGLGKLASPWDVEFIGKDKLAIANAGTHQILLYDIEKDELSVLAGSGREDIIDGPALSAPLAQPSGLSYYDGVLYFVDAESSSLRQLKDGQVTTLIGTGLFDFGFKDGKYPAAKLQHPQGLYVDRGKIYIADTYNDAVRIYDLKTGELSTQKLVQRKLNEPGDVYKQGMGLFVVNTNNHEIDRAVVGSPLLQEIKVQ